MSFISDAYNFITGNSIGGQLARTALTAFTLNRVTASINRDNETKLAETGTNSARIDLGTRIQINPNTETHIPVAYGKFQDGGIITDAYLSSDNLRLTVVITICEKTGSVYSTGADGVISCEGVVLNDSLLRFKSDGQTVEDAINPDNTVTTNLNGLIKVWFFDGNSESPRALSGYESAQSKLVPAYNRIADWDSTYKMENLVFAVCEITYSKENNLTGLPDFRFLLNNNITQVGDCLADYMSNSVYGAGYFLGTEVYTE